MNRKLKELANQLIFEYNTTNDISKKIELGILMDTHPELRGYIEQKLKIQPSSESVDVQTMFENLPLEPQDIDQNLKKTIGGKFSKSITHQKEIIRSLVNTIICGSSDAEKRSAYISLRVYLNSSNPEIVNYAENFFINQARKFDKSKGSFCNVS